MVMSLSYMHFKTDLSPPLRRESYLRGDDVNGRQRVFSGAFQLLMYTPGGGKAPGKNQKIYYTGVREERVDQADQTHLQQGRDPHFDK